jgi:hypothetical protein
MHENQIPREDLQSNNLDLGKPPNPPAELDVQNSEIGEKPSSVSDPLLIKQVVTEIALSSELEIAKSRLEMQFKLATYTMLILAATIYWGFCFPGNSLIRKSSICHGST